MFSKIVMFSFLRSFIWRRVSFISIQNFCVCIRKMPRIIFSNLFIYLSNSFAKDFQLLWTLCEIMHWFFFHLLIFVIVYPEYTKQRQDKATEKFWYEIWYEKKECDSILFLLINIKYWFKVKPFVGIALNGNVLLCMICHVSSTQSLEINLISFHMFSSSFVSFLNKIQNHLLVPSFMILGFPFNLLFIFLSSSFKASINEIILLDTNRVIKPSTFLS